MMNFIESSAGRIAARIQTLGGNFDPEVLSLPGGSIIAILLCLYATTMFSLNRAPPRQQHVEPIAACRGCLGHDWPPTAVRHLFLLALILCFVAPSATPLS
jgi:hypothetical protein